MKEEKHLKKDKKSKHKKDKKNKKDKKDKKSYNKEEKKRKKDKKENKEKEENESESSENQEEEGQEEDNRNKNNKISIDDYFNKSEEFRVWLKINNKRSFEELDSSETHNLFEEFCTLWNQNKLPTMYYDGIPSEIRHECMRTKHRWGIRLSESEKNQISEVSDGVDLTTRKKFDNAWNHMTSSNNNHSTSSTTTTRDISKTNHVVGPDIPAEYLGENLKRPMDAYDREEERERAAKARKYEKYQESHRIRTLAEEIAPREKGREAQLDKKKEVSNRMRSMAQDREDSRDGLNLKESDIMGGGDDFASVKARFDRNKEKKESEKMERIRELQERDQERQRNFMSQLGVDFSHGPIKIAPRNN